MIAGLAAAKFQRDVKLRLQHEGKWKGDPTLVMTTILADTKDWRKITAINRSSRSAQDSSYKGGSKNESPSTKTKRGNPTCFSCGQVGQYADKCPECSASFSGLRTSRKGRGKGRRKAGGKGSSGRGGSSSSQASSGTGEAAPQRAVQVGANSSRSAAVAAAPVQGPSMPPAAAPAVSPAAAPGVSATAPGVGSPGQWSDGWTYYSPGRYYEQGGGSLTAPPAQPWCHLGISSRSPDEVAAGHQDVFVPAELCFPGQHTRGALSVRAVLDSGAHVSSIAQPIVELLE